MHICKLLFNELANLVSAEDELIATLFLEGLPDDDAFAMLVLIAGQVATVFIMQNLPACALRIRRPCIDITLGIRAIRPRCMLRRASSTIHTVHCTYSIRGLEFRACACCAKVVVRMLSDSCTGTSASAFGDDSVP